MSQTPGSLSGPDHRGQLLDNRYFLEKIIGVGGMATVYRAHDLRLPSTGRGQGHPPRILALVEPDSSR
ncbi:MAG: hypothetical protein KC468_15940 [Myxococcales bacterium]|nr:hypothetical protein [Myxococcales bacterium]